MSRCMVVSSSKSCFAVCQTC